jgi:hypothetical protein
MKFEFIQGVPEEGWDWLRTNVGPGNLFPGKGLKDTHWQIDRPEYAWFYKRESRRQIRTGNLVFDYEYVPTITVKDPKMAVWFELRWS